MALTNFQRDVLGCISSNRSPNSVLFGGAALNLTDHRISNDLDLQHYSREAVKTAFDADRDTLQAAGYTVEQTQWSRPENGFIQALAAKNTESTLIDWTQDSAWRFYPAIKDAEVGWRLHDADLAVNKILALAGRREPRDYYDAVRLHERGVKLAALAWAAPAKDPGFTPDFVLDEISRNSVYDPEVIAREILTNKPLDPVMMRRIFADALAEARDLFATLHNESPGALFIDSAGNICAPNPNLVESGALHRHEASIGGVWPSIIQDR
jgi:hypothetical protein